MRKILAVALVGLLGIAPAAWADEVTGWEVIDQYDSEQELGLRSADIMMMEAWTCFVNTQVVMRGAEIKEMGFSLEDVLANTDMKGDYLRLFIKGYEYEKPTDKAIGEIQAQCLVDAHKKIVSR